MEYSAHLQGDDLEPRKLIKSWSEKRTLHVCTKFCRNVFVLSFLDRVQNFLVFWSRAVSAKACDTSGEEPGSNLIRAFIVHGRQQLEKKEDSSE